MCNSCRNKGKKTPFIPGPAPKEDGKAPGPGNEWFSDLFGFSETNYETAKKWLQCEPDAKRDGYFNLRSLVNSKLYNVGKFTTPTLGELRTTTFDFALMTLFRGKLSLRLDLGDVALKQASAQFYNATFQAASQFNCLEFPNPRVTPEKGITNYIWDHTQGPACSISAGPATAYRNYFTPLNVDGETQLGQTTSHQINNLCDFNIAVGNVPEGKYFSVNNGYTKAEDAGLEALNTVLVEKSEVELDLLRSTVCMWIVLIFLQSFEHYHYLKYFFPSQLH